MAGRGSRRALTPYPPAQRSRRSRARMQGAQAKDRGAVSSKLRTRLEAQRRRNGVCSSSRRVRTDVIHRLIEQQTMLDGNRLAIIERKGTITYRALNTRANALARVLMCAG